MEVDGAKKPGWQRWLVGLLTAAALWWLATRRTEVAAVAQTISTGRWEWLLLASLTYAGSLGLSTLNYRRAFVAVGLSLEFWDVLATLLAALVVGEIAPFGWAACSSVFLRLATNRGFSASHAAVGVLLAQAADLLAFSGLFLVGIAALLLHHLKPGPSVTAGAVFLLLMNVGLLGVLALAVQRPAALGKLLGRIPSERARAVATKAVSGLVAAGEAIREKPGRLLASLGAAVGANAASTLCLFFVFLAFRQPVTFGQLVMGYGVGTLAWMISPIPAGVGVVEGAMALAFASLGVPTARAAVLAVTYRGLSFWLPFLVGLFTLHRQNALFLKEPKT